MVTRLLVHTIADHEDDPSPVTDATAARDWAARLVDACVTVLAAPHWVERIDAGLTRNGGSGRPSAARVRDS
ncbi:MAG: hypothetical protein AB7J32_21265 [Pseudonocardia sp.]